MVFLSLEIARPAEPISHVPLTQGLLGKVEGNRLLTKTQGSRVRAAHADLIPEQTLLDLQEKPLFFESCAGGGRGPNRLAIKSG